MSAEWQLLQKRRYASGFVTRAEAFAFVGRELGLAEMELCSKRRDQHLVFGRALFVWIVRNHGPSSLSYPVIGRWLGGRHHTTIMHLFKSVAPWLLGNDRQFRELCELFKRQFDERNCHAEQ